MSKIAFSKGRIIRKFDTDKCMQKLYVYLHRDFLENHSVGHESFHVPLKLITDGRIKDFRDYVWPSRANVEPHLYKWLYQLETLYKRYRFENDAYTDKELYQKSYDAFVDTQTRVSQPLKMTPFVYKVVSRARNIIKDILGSYDLEEHYAACRFGKRACNGHEYRKSYLDLKISGPITGSTEHIAWFQKYLLTDAKLSAIVDQSMENGAAYEVCSTLDLALVPKSWKSLRPVKPQTLLGTFITNGLGTVLASRLLKVRLNIRRLQEQHKRLVREASKDRKLVTADLSAASDSISWELLCRLLPRKWLGAVMLGCARYVQGQSGVKVRLSSVATMGDGHTFPLQTLIFYSLIKAVGELKGQPDAKVSVYGDDLIYPTDLHQMVTYTLRCLHFNLNLEKTYAKGYFRESCGSDCYRGIDVRPFSPEGECQRYSARPYAAFLYKLLNGLLRRWEWDEIPNTVTYLLSEIIIAEGKAYSVPPSYPDYSGVRTARPYDNHFLLTPPAYNPNKYKWTFESLAIALDDRLVVRQDIYYWERLRVCAESAYTERVEAEFDQFKTGQVKSDFQGMVAAFLGLPQSIQDDALEQQAKEYGSCREDLPLLIWRKTKPPVYRYSYRLKKRLRVKYACVPMKGHSRVVSETNSTSAWI